MPEEGGKEKGAGPKPAFPVDPSKQPGLSLFALNLGAITTLALVREKFGADFVGATHSAVAAFAVGIACAAYAVFCQVLDQAAGVERRLSSGPAPVAEPSGRRTATRARDRERTRAAAFEQLTQLWASLRIAVLALALVLLGVAGLFAWGVALKGQWADRETLTVYGIVYAVVSAVAFALYRVAGYRWSDQESPRSRLAPLYLLAEALSLSAFMVGIGIACFSVAAVELPKPPTGPEPQPPTSPPANSTAPANGPVSVVIVQSRRAPSPPPKPEVVTIYRTRTVYRTRWRTAPASCCTAAASVCRPASVQCPAPATAR